MKYYEFKESLKKKAKNLKDIKIGLKEAQRTLFFNSFDREGKHHGFVHRWNENLFTPEQLRRHKLADEAYTRCLRSYWAAYKDYRARHIAYSLFRGRTPEQIESNYYEGKWETYYDLQGMIDKHLEQLRVDNPPKVEYKEVI